MRRLQDPITGAVRLLGDGGPGDHDGDHPDKSSGQSTEEAADPAAAPTRSRLAEDL